MFILSSDCKNLINLENYRLQIKHKIDLWVMTAESYTNNNNFIDLYSSNNISNCICIMQDISNYIDSTNKKVYDLSKIIIINDNKQNESKPKIYREQSDRPYYDGGYIFNKEQPDHNYLNIINKPYSEDRVYKVTCNPDTGTTEVNNNGQNIS